MVESTRADAGGREEQGTTPVTFDRTKKNMRNQSVGWLWDAYQTVNDETLVKKRPHIQKAFEGCRAKQWDLSYARLTSFDAREKLRAIKTTDPSFWQQLEDRRIRALEEHNAGDARDGEETYDCTVPDDADEDDSDISCAAVKRATIQSEPGLTSADKVAEALDHDDGDVEEDTGHDTAEDPIGKRRRRPNTRYQNFWRHREGPGIDSEDEEYE
ncbi:hypothetical protein B0H13DRAFT_1862060 [Mycena leptocephala]|nr:hypothetical protein B0H13DRAFT_1862060 [Mycena leptocephala]